MLKEFDPPAQDGTKKIKEEIKELREEIVLMQQKIKEARLPVFVIVEGWSAAGKGTLIRNLIKKIDPRFFHVIHNSIIPETERQYPFLYPYASAMPENGQITFLDAGYMDEAVKKQVRREITAKTFGQWVRSVNQFERTLKDNGYVLLKIFLHIDKNEQFAHLEKLRSNAETAWRATDEDLWQNSQYDCFLEKFDEFMKLTDKHEKWHIISGYSRPQATRDVLKLLVEKIEAALKNGKYVGDPVKESFPLIKMPKLSEVDLTPTISDEEYSRELDRLQEKLAEQHNIIFRKKIPVVICYEGWDAAGKGGNIRRVAAPLDPRSFIVEPIASPEPHELARHYLWRFWTRLPKSGTITIFDRTWYGRVMVERLENLCSEKDWKRAYNEMNEFERDLTEWGALVLKFWLHIDSDTQLDRFNDRQNTPEKQWKITDEDWRNRDKWDDYEKAVNEMLEKTSTENAPWYIIESNDKQYARIRTLRIITNAIEKAIENKI
ncbi:MAG: phosphate--AMP phosphotransferase [Eubacteriales bacterium]|nr:phosphate--AMP phosphotransferase [Eubacteriales bacterium]